MFKRLGSTQKKEVFKDLNLFRFESKRVARPKCDLQHLLTPCAPPKKPSKKATHEFPECPKYGTRCDVDSVHWSQRTSTNFEHISTGQLARKNLVDRDALMLKAHGVPGRCLHCLFPEREVQQEWAHSRIRIHEGNTPVWNSGRERPEFCDVFEHTAQITLPEARTWRNRGCQPERTRHPSARDSVGARKFRGSSSTRAPKTRTRSQECLTCNR